MRVKYYKSQVYTAEFNNILARCIYAPSINCENPPELIKFIFSILHNWVYTVKLVNIDTDNQSRYDEAPVYKVYL